MPKKRPYPALILFIAAACFAVPWAIGRWQPEPKVETPPFTFPTPELARLDRDLQARIAEVPTKDFGIVRVSGNQHDLYVPSNKNERETISQLKSKKLDVAFYLMSRATWLRSYDGTGFKPIQGPVYLTGRPLKGPLPRAINFYPNKISPLPTGQRNGILDQPNDLETNTPDGTPRPSPTPPPGAPKPNQLQMIGNDLFETAENEPGKKNLGLKQKATKPGWDIVAVPIRASSPACLKCHGPGQPGQTYIQIRQLQQRSQRPLAVGDPLGIAFYIYRTTPELNS